MASSSSKPTLLLDCDGVIIDITKQILEFVSSYYPNRTFTYDQITQHDAFTALGVPELDPVWRRACDEQELCLKMLPYEGSHEFMREAAKIANIVIVTAPLQKCRTWHWQRTEWLRRNFGINHKQVIFAGDKSHVDGEIFIDDSLHNIVKWKMAHSDRGDAIVFDRPWNQTDKNFYVSGRIFNYEQALEAILEWV